jgi:hypothetical protein
VDLISFVSEATAGSVQGRTRLTPTGIRPQIMDKIHQLGAAAEELTRLLAVGRT